jgi:hypothetical protein
MPILSSAQIRSIVEDRWQRDAAALVVGLHVAPAIDGPAEVEFEFGRARVLRADTVFEFREALLRAEQEQSRLVLLTGLQQTDLGNDVVGRLVRSRLFPIDHWASLCSLFRARQLDRAVLDAAVVRSLLENAPADGYPPVSAGVLDAGTVWRSVCRHVFDMGEREPELLSVLLLWATTESGSRRYQAAAPELRESLGRRLQQTVGEGAASVLRIVQHGFAADAVAIAVACQVIYGSGDEALLDAPAGRLERFHGNLPLSRALGRALGNAAAEAISDLDRLDETRRTQDCLQRADELLKQLGCADHVHRSTLTRWSFDRRLERLGEAVGEFLKQRSAATLLQCETRLLDVLNHRFASLNRNRDQVVRAEMSVRLLRWLGTAFEPATSFAELASQYVREVSFVDWAREPLSRGEDLRAVSSVYQQLDRVVLERRERVSQAFAELLSDWTSAGASNSAVLGVEDVLTEVVAPVAAAGSGVLLIVLDGMSWAICHEILEDIRQDHWFEATLHESGEVPQPVIAAIPSETKYSRASLLTGTLQSGGQSAEKRGFENCGGLVQHSIRAYSPRLFHKGELTDGNRGVISAEVTRAISEPAQRIVAVVINAIDDRLSNAQQVLDNWSISRISPLRSLLRLARDAGRVVVLASDHGHIWHRPDGEHRDGSESSRWRETGSGAREDEVVLSGRRVLAGAGSITAPWSEKVRFSGQQNGYHGGATPQEMVCPLVLLRGRTDGHGALTRCEYPRPDWWSAAPVAVPEAPQIPVSVAVPPRFIEPGLFDHEPEPPVVAAGLEHAAVSAGTVTDDGWISRLLLCEAYRNQKVLVRRHALDDNKLRQCLSSLDASGGIMTPVAFARAADLPMARLDGLIATMQRVLNVDGYESLTMDRTANRVQLNVARLKRQFGLE